MTWNWWVLVQTFFSIWGKVLLQLHVIDKYAYCNFIPKISEKNSSLYKVIMDDTIVVKEVKISHQIALWFDTCWEFLILALEIHSNCCHFQLSYMSFTVFVTNMVPHPWGNFVFTAPQNIKWFSWIHNCSLYRTVQICTFVLWVCIEAIYHKSNETKEKC